ncbi:MAG: class I SAM-dependent methyltransferase, partial [Candidatus Hodarchaeota archaeon]
MEPEKDAYGQEIWAQFKGRESFEIVERDDGYFGASGSVKIYFSKYEEWEEYEKEAIKFCKGKILDIGCGAGRHSLYLQENGFDVLGIDISPVAIKTCKERGLKKARVLSIEDIEKLKPERFDTIIMFGNNFGLFGSFNKARILLEKFSKITSLNAIIIAQTRDPYKTDNPAHLEYQEFNKKRGRM